LFLLRSLTTSQWLYTGKDTKKTTGFFSAFFCVFWKEPLDLCVKDNFSAFSILVSKNEKAPFVAFAEDMEIPYNAIMRRLIIYFVDGNISWEELFKQHSELPVEDLPDSARNISAHQIEAGATRGVC
jgi:hypothetical protein